MSSMIVCTCGEQVNGEEHQAHLHCAICGRLLGHPSPESLEGAREPREQSSVGPGEQAPKEGRTTPRALEANWHECLLYPLRTWSWVLYLGFGMTWSTGIVLRLLWGTRETLEFLVQTAAGWLFMLLGVAAFTYTCAFFTAVVRSAASGETSKVRGPGLNLRLLAQGVLLCVGSFLGGPAIAAAVGVYFWLRTGDLALVDQLILFELGLATSAYWLLVFLGLSVEGRWSEATPAAVCLRAQQLGARGILALGLGCSLLVLHIWFLLLQVGWRLPALEEFPRAAIATWGLLLFCWISLLFWTTFVLRWLGICWFRSQRRELPVAVSQPLQNATCQQTNWIE